MKCLNVDNINPNFVVMEYAVRGPLVIRAGEIEKELEQVSARPFLLTPIVPFSTPHSSFFVFTN